VLENLIANKNIYLTAYLYDNYPQATWN